MFRKLKENWRTYLLAILTAAVSWLGGNEVYTSINADDTGRLIRTPEISQPDPGLNLYTITAAFYEVDQVKVGNFPNVTIEDDLGPFTVRVEKPSANYVEAKFKERFPEYTNAKVRLPFHKVVKPKEKEEDDFREEETVQKE